MFAEKEKVNLRKLLCHHLETLTLHLQVQIVLDLVGIILLKMSVELTHLLPVIERQTVLKQQIFTFLLVQPHIIFILLFLAKMYQEQKKMEPTIVTSFQFPHLGASSLQSQINQKAYPGASIELRTLTLLFGTPFSYRFMAILSVIYVSQFLPHYNQ